MSSPTPSPLALDPLAILRERFAAAIAAAFPQSAGSDPLLAPSKNPKFGEFQCNAAMSLAKSLGKPPRDVAAAILAAVNINDIAEPLTPASIAGPGFINITLRPDALAHLLSLLAAPGLGLATAAPGAAGTVVVDLCGVNLAKEMHVGHLRSTVIGDTLARMLQRTGWHVIRQNHVGDWGLPIAMVAARLIALRDGGKLDLRNITLSQLDDAYRAAKRDADADAPGLAAARRWDMGPKVIAELEAQAQGAADADAASRDVLAKLQARDPAVMAVWQRISDVTMAACLDVCRRLNAIVLPEHSAGESSYAAELEPLVADLLARGIAEPSQGALIVRLDDHGIREPLLVRKRDGAFLYATTDMAAIRRRVGTLGASRVVYCVDARQGLHFQQVFAACAKAGYTAAPGRPAAVLEHAAFGMMLGNDGKPFKTRSGENVKLADLLDEAQTRAEAAVAAKNADADTAQRAEIARAVALAAVRYADLSSERSKDYVFDFDRMIAFEGNTGPYLLYALVRIKSIQRKAAERFPGESPDDTTPFVLTQPAERTLALALLRFPQVVLDAADSLEPHRICQYCYDLATAFSAFFDACPVLAADSPATRAARLRLCSLTGRVLAESLEMLGIPTLERM